MADIDIDKAFLGIGWSFPPEFQKDVDVLGLKMVAEGEDIAESLRILLSTSPGERVMQPSYGCGLRTKVFGIINQSSVTEIRDIIERAVLFFEPRVELEDIEIDTDDALEGKLKINLTYRVRKTNTRSNIVYPFYFLEGSQVRV